ncbi:hypothetical protein L917_02745 [Phytophthora nicotianae]|uniref:TNF family profile domain-containing protein n=1 Tax=Phytophthora nicotianae TaxID=4792 RepID=W2LSS0_PHYNI|nr:hypothetical protein L917_02745 [Phytophthora nicotianae]
MDYASYFRQCLDCLSDRSQESHRKLESRVNSGLRLELSFNLRLLESVRNANYVFELKPVAVERIDLLESRLRDQEEEMEQLRGQVDLSDRAFLYAESAVWTASTLQWKPLASDKFILAADSTSITFRIPGLYAIAVLVNHWPNQNNTSGTISLIKNDVKIQRAVTGSTNLYDSGYGKNLSAGHRTSTSLMCVVQAKEDDRIAVSCTKTTYVDDTASYLTAARMGF